LRATRSYDDCKALQATMRAVDDEEEEEGLAGCALAGLDLDGDQVIGGTERKVSGASVSTARGRKIRRHTYDPAVTVGGLGSQQAPAGQHSHHRHLRSGSGSMIAGGVTYPAALKQHRRSGSGSLIAGIAGFSNRVHPTTWMEGSGEFDSDSVSTGEK
jgi:hypothetical protein